MKLIKIIALIFLCCIQNSSFAIDKNNKIEEEVGIIIADNQKYIRFEYGANYAFIIYIVEGDTRCDVYITTKGEGPIMLTACEKTPILEWAFDKLEDELKSAEFMTDNTYKTFYHILSLFKNNEEIISESSKKFVTGNKGLEKKIKELGSFIINELWIEKYNIPLGRWK